MAAGRRRRTTTTRGTGLLAAAAMALLLPASPAASAPKPAPYFTVVQGPRVEVTGSYTPLVGHFHDLRFDDIVWYSPKGVDQVWEGGAGGDALFTRHQLVPQIGGGFTPVVGDFAGDRHDDIYWYAPNGQDRLWTTGADGTFTATTTLEQGPNLRPVVLPDSDTSTGKDDLVWQATGTQPPPPSPLWVFPDSGTGVASTTATVQLGNDTGFPVGDFDGDGDADLLAFPSTLLRRDGGESSTFTDKVQPQPIASGGGPVGRYGANGDQRRDIVLMGAVQPAPSLDVPSGPIGLLEGQADGTFSKTTSSGPSRAGFPFGLEGTTKGVVLIGHLEGTHLPQGQQDIVWWLGAGGPTGRTTGNGNLVGFYSFEHPALIGYFTSRSRQDLLTYAPGKGGESLWHVR